MNPFAHNDAVAATKSERVPDGPTGLLDSLNDLRCILAAKSSGKEKLQAIDGFAAFVDACFAKQQEETRSFGHLLSSAHLEAHRGILKQIDFLRLWLEIGDLRKLPRELAFLDTWLRIHLSNELLEDGFSQLPEEKTAPETKRQRPDVSRKTRTVSDSVPGGGTG